MTMQKITVELDPKSLAAVDQELARLRAQMPGESLTRSDAVRSLILESIAKGDRKPTWTVRCGLACPDKPEWICVRLQGHTGRHESADGGDWHD